MRTEYTEDKLRVLKWMSKYCYGYRKRRVKPNILPYVNLNERYFRQIVRDLKHEGHICSTTEGYWFTPLYTNDYMEILMKHISDAGVLDEAREEIGQARHSWLELRSRAMDMLTDCDRHLKKLTDLEHRVTGGQLELFEKIGQSPLDK